MTDSVELDDLLLAHAAGTLAGPLALLVRCHVRLRPASRARLRLYEQLAGLCLEELDPTPVDPARREAVLARLGEMVVCEDPAPSGPETLPVPLSRLEWRQTGAGISEARLPGTGDGRLEARMLRIEPGCGPGRHRHEGREFVLVLDGAFRDEFGLYRRGDVVICDARIEHAPVAEGPSPCLCLEVRERPAGTAA